MSERSSALLKLYQSLIKQIQQEYQMDNTLTANDLFQSVAHGKQFLALKQGSDIKELALVEEFLKRDISAFLKQQNESSLASSPTMLAIENTLWHWLGEISDRSQVEWHELAQEFEHHGFYQVGDIVSQGQIICNQCGHGFNIEFPTTIPSCTECDCEQFSREPLEP
ncbi:hypothetical protein D5R81_05340 [Parashewanella spongiae]|uniref:Zinc ribbon-containing protein n=1 Tax=Parashewanella spongiae TaxID=342950 RepID=A0A3A6UAA4_9GAMM|nr:zinc ribbon-containing protein [Parashewanella spongiae]MCL1079554.1 zinc ribbon-containing protein [Parashewanella spongiae]RJY18459.1 hypothetical protein D5R81_05340 [Parashewanella spongiae]